MNESNEIQEQQLRETAALMQKVSRLTSYPEWTAFVEYGEAMIRANTPMPTNPNATPEYIGRMAVYCAGIRDLLGVPSKGEQWLKENAEAVQE